MEQYRYKTGKRITYEEISRRTGIARTTIESIGSRSAYNTTLETVDKLCDALECSIEELLERKSERER